ncbi:hypothetical protein J4216_06520 [Candidatus Woesearchaeota archaeon]|nr:hypothetical protein [Candidatus Woesearchaeota archaeon]
MARGKKERSILISEKAELSIVVPIKLDLLAILLGASIETFPNESISKLFGNREGNIIYPIIAFPYQVADRTRQSVDFENDGANDVNLYLRKFLGLKLMGDHHSHPYGREGMSLELSDEDIKDMRNSVNEFQTPYLSLVTAIRRYNTRELRMVSTENGEIVLAYGRYSTRTAGYQLNQKNGRIKRVKLRLET